MLVHKSKSRETRMEKFPYGVPVESMENDSHILMENFVSIALLKHIQYKHISSYPT